MAATGSMRLKADAQIQARPEDTLVPARIAELVIVGGLDADVEASNRRYVEADLRTDDEPVLHSLAVDAAAVDGEGRPEDAEVGREIETHHGPAGEPVIDAIETPERHLLEGYAAEKARKGAEYQLGANQIVRGLAAASADDRAAPP